MSMILLLERIEADAVSVPSEPAVTACGATEESFTLRIAHTDCDDDSDDMDAIDDDFADEDFADVFDGMLPGFDSENSISLEKAWHGLHFLLTGDPWGGSGHAAFLLAGGREAGEDTGYGPARVIDAAEVRGIDRTLQGVTSTELWSRFDAQAWREADIYPGCADEPEEDLREEYLGYFEELKDFVAETAACRGAMRITMA
jgi:hypothetical protein